MKNLRLAVSLVSVLLLTVFAASAHAGVSVGHSGWTWGDPSPQGNAIATLEFVGSRGYAAGAFGTLLRTDNAGASWIGIPTGITQPIKRIRIIDGDSLVIAGGCALRRSDDAGQSFTRLPWTASEVNCDDEITSFAFPTDQIGYILTTQRIVFRTANGGRTWARKTTLPAGPLPTGTSSSPDVAFTGPDVGVALSGGQIYRTTDGGGSWKLVANHSNGLNGLFFLGATGYAVGGGTSLLKSADGGATWEVKSAGGALILTSIRCADASTCLATTLATVSPQVGAPSPVVLRTTDGGTSLASISPSTYGIGAAAFASPTRAVAIGEKGATVVSDDAGVTWSGIGGILGEAFTRLRATSPTLALAVGEKGALARTTDSGATWTRLNVSTSGNVVDASFLSPTVGYALDSTGAALKTDDGAASWQILTTGTQAKPNALVAFDANQVLLIGPTGLRRSTNGGGEFSGVKGKASRSARLSDYDRAGSSTFAYGAKALISSTNNGKSWKKVKRPPRASLGTVDFVSKRLGFAVTTKGALWQTRNGGRRWSRLLGTGYAHPNSDVFDVSFSSARSGWFVANSFGETGIALRTSDGGKTWRPQVVTEQPIFGIVATGDKTGLLHTYGENLFATTTGGDAGTPTTLKLKANKRQVKKRTRVKVTGKLTPAEGAERVTVSAFDGRRWRKATETVASNGTFTTTWRVSRTSYFVAQWAGDDDRAGDGTTALVVKVRKRRR